MYTYYSKHEIEEHMLYADEIAQALNIYSERDISHDKFVHAFIKKFTETNDTDNYQQLYFLNKYGGMKKVYPPYFLNIINDFLNEHVKDNNVLYAIKLNNKTYKIKRNGDIKNA